VIISEDLLLRKKADELFLRNEMELVAYFRP